MGGAWISRNGRGYDGDSCVITVAPKSRTHSSSAPRSTVDSQFEIWSATSLPIPSTLRRSPRLAERTCCGCLKTSSNLRSRTGPTVGSMLSAMHASVAFMKVHCERLACGQNTQAGGSRYFKTGSRLRPAQLGQIVWVARWFVDFLHLTRQLHHRDARQATAWFRPRHEASFAFAPSACHPSCPFANALR